MVSYMSGSYENYTVTTVILWYWEIGRKKYAHLSVICDMCTIMENNQVVIICHLVKGSLEEKKAYPVCVIYVMCALSVIRVRCTKITL